MIDVITELGNRLLNTTSRLGSKLEWHFIDCKRTNYLYHTTYLRDDIKVLVNSQFLQD